MVVAVGEGPVVHWFPSVFVVNAKVAPITESWPISVMVLTEPWLPFLPIAMVCGAIMYTLFATEAYVCTLEK